MSLFINYGAMAGEAEKILSYYGKAGNTTIGVYPGTVTVGNYIMFVAGGDKNSCNYTVRTLSNSFVYTTQTKIPGYNTEYASGAAYLSGCSFADCAIIGSGSEYDDDSRRWGAYPYVHRYTTSLVRTSLTNLTAGCFPGQPSDAAATTNYILFDTNHDTKHYQPYNSNGVKSTEISSTYRFWTAATTTFQNCAIFAGGNYINVSGYQAYSSSVVRFDNSLGKASVAMSEGKYYGAAVSTDEYLLIGGGSKGSGGGTDKVEVFNSSFVRQTNLTLTEASVEPVAVALGDKSIFITANKKVNVFDGALLRTTMTDIGTVPHYRGAAKLDNYAIFSVAKSTPICTAEVYQLS